MQFPVSFPGGTVQFLTHSSFSQYAKLAPAEDCFFVTDEHIAGLYPALLADVKAIVIPAGEAQKNLRTTEHIIAELLRLGAQRGSYVVGLGGGVVTDIAGFAASVYMRGVKFGFIPTTLLGMVDAAIGGKNGVDVGLFKNVAGTFNQPEFIVYDTSFLNTLPEVEWRNGFAEIIKYACLFDEEMFDELSANNIDHYRDDESAIQSLIKRCVDWKNKIVLADEKEKGERKLLNFGHTLGHAIENLYGLPHGHAVAIGMALAARVSEATGISKDDVANKVAGLLQQYQLPVSYPFDTESVMNVLVKDKKRVGNNIDYIVLEKIGKGTIVSLSADQIAQNLNLMQDAIGR